MQGVDVELYAMLVASRQSAEPMPGRIQDLLSMPNGSVGTLCFRLQRPAHVIVGI